MNVIKVVGLLLVTCLSIELQAMKPSYSAEQRLLNGNISVGTYFSGLEKGHARMVNALRTADYRQLPDGSYYEELINEINDMVSSIRFSGINGNTFRALKFKIRRFIEAYYDMLNDAKERGTVKVGRGT